MKSSSVWLVSSSVLIIAACVVAARAALNITSREQFAPLYAASGVIGRRRQCSPAAAMVVAAASGSAHDRLIAAARTQSALYPSVLPS